MAYETDEARDAARQRLQARMERRNSTQAASKASPPKASAISGQPASLETFKPPRKRPSIGTVGLAGSSAATLPARPSAPPVVAIALSTLVIVALVAFSLTQCVSIAPADDSVEEPLAAEQAVPTVKPDLSSDAQAKLVDLIGEQEAGKLLAAATTNPDTLWIAAHSDEYDADGFDIQVKLLKLAADEPAAREYVRAWPNQYPTAKPSSDATIAMSSKSPSGDIPDTQVPHLYQWDRRWGYTTYSSASFGLTGCGPTALAMVAQALTDKHDVTPYEMGEIAKEHGSMTEFNGTGSEFFVEMADELNLYCELLYPTGDAIKGALSDGAVIIANMGPGQFTDNGHYFVLTGLADGRVIINDPYSVERSSQTWDADTIADESIALFAYTKA